MILDLETHDPHTFANPHVIIVGAGAVGLTLAVDLVRSGRRVLVLEAGPRYMTKHSQSLMETASWQGFSLKGLHLGRVRALGGTTNLWGGQLVQMEPSVFGKRPWLTDTSWPVTEAELTPYYQRAFDLLGLQKRIPDDRDVWDRLKIRPPENSRDIELFFTRWAPEPSFARLYDSEIGKGINLGVVVNAQVTALKMEGERVSGVKAKALSGRELTFAAPVVVLANGTVEIVRLLQLRLADGQKPGWSDNQWLGKGFLDHLDCYAGHVQPIDKARFHEIFDNAYLSGIKYSPKLRLSSDAQMRHGMASVAGHFLFNSSVAEHLSFAKTFVRSLLRGRPEANVSALPRELWSMAQIALPMAYRYVRNRRMYNPADRGIQLRITAEQRPMMANRISLVSEKDALGIPQVTVHWSVADDEIETLARFGELLADYLGANGLAAIDLDPGLKSRDPDFLKGVDDANHQMGGARMAETARDGVVDADLRVFGTQNLYVAGAAVYPTTGFPNPTFTAIALGLRLASKLKASLP
jgi:choline dehydrogenase-like flavoprotein